MGRFAFLFVLFFALGAQAKEKVLIIETPGQDALNQVIETANVQGVNDALLGSHGLTIKSVIDRSENFEGWVIEGDHQKAAFWQAVEKTIAAEKIKYVNMSFNFLVKSLGSTDVEPWQMPPPGVDNPLEIDKQNVKFVRDLIDNHPEILFVVSSGNGLSSSNYSPFSISADFTFDMVPTVFENNNILVVGAINTDDVVPELLGTYKMSTFSNFGIVRVDVLAPGEHVKDNFTDKNDGAQPFESGTSFAAPYAYLALDKVKGLLPEATVAEQKDIVLKSVYVRDVQAYLDFTEEQIYKLEDSNKSKIDEFLSQREQFFLVKSGGIIYPDRTLQLATVLKGNPALSVSDAAALVMKADGLDGEAYKKFWKNRGL